MISNKFLSLLFFILLHQIIFILAQLQIFPSAEEFVFEEGGAEEELTALEEEFTMLGDPVINFKEVVQIVCASIPVNFYEALCSGRYNPVCAQNFSSSTGVTAESPCEACIFYSSDYYVYGRCP